MRATLIVLLFAGAFMLLIAGQLLVTGYYPAAVPVRGPDGVQLTNANGTPLVHRDMEKYSRLSAPSRVAFRCSAVLFIWGLALVAKHVYEQKKRGANQRLHPSPR
jgi:hypothetical protein